MSNPIGRRRCSVKALLLATVAALTSAGVAHAQVKHHQFDIPAGDAVTALQAFSKQAGVQTLFSYDAAAGRRTPAIHGDLPDQQVLDELAKSAGLAVVSNDGHTITLQPAPSPAPNAPPASSEAANVAEVIVTGTRATNRTVTSSLAPIDVLPSTELAKSGKQSPRDLISTLVPSATTSNSGAGASFAVKTVSLRGLDADQTLVLVDGKRRHNTSILFVNGTTQNGQSPPDLDLIPISAIDHIEVLRDGASAQYGSDALAGVINVILKKQPEGGELSVEGGQYIDGGGLDEQTTGNIGLPVGKDGALNLSFDLRDQAFVNRGVPYTGVFFPLIGGQPDPRESTVDRDINHPGLPAIQLYSGSEDFTYPINENAEFYAFGTFSSRDSRAWLTPRLPGGAANQIIQVYPLGYSPELRLLDHDYQQTGGIKGDNLFGFTYDLSTSYSMDNVDYNENSLNASLGPASPTYFYLGTLRTNESTTNFDVTRSVPTALYAKPLFLAAAGIILIDRSRIGDLTLGNPREKFIFSTEYMLGKFDGTLRVNGYGSVVSVASVAAGGAAADTTVSAAATVDLDLAYKVTNKLTLSIGGNNLLNRYPNVVPPIDRGATGFTYTNQYSPFGIAGGFYYGKLTYAF